jgi:heptosyltransferase-3
MWGPLGEHGRVVASKDHDCRPCGKDGCDGTKVSECLTSIPAERVIREIDDLAALGFPRSRIGYEPIGAKKGG